ncbi:MAG: hypothetical protein AAGB48_07075 [Planctomycetota bacterium]
MAGLMRNLGRFVGEIGRAIRTPVSSRPADTRTTVETESRPTPQGRVTLTRTTVEEIRVEPDERAGSQG